MAYDQGVRSASTSAFEAAEMEAARREAAKHDDVREYERALSRLREALNGIDFVVRNPTFGNRSPEERAHDRFHEAEMALLDVRATWNAAMRAKA